MSVTIEIKNCLDCPHHVVLSDADPYDRFNGDDQKVFCDLAKKYITVACRSYKLKEENEIPLWCPLSKKTSTKKVFLSGTINSSWRDKLIPMLKCDYFNPVVERWTKDAILIEKKEKELADFRLYVLTPKTKGLFLIAEVVDDSNKIPEKTLFCILEKDGGTIFDKMQMLNLNAVAEIVFKNGGQVFYSLKDITDFLNNI